jgi:hypothetical protein
LSPSSVPAAVLTDRLQLGLAARHELGVGGQQRVDAGADAAVDLRLEVAEAEVLQLGVQPLDAEAAGQRRVDLHRLAGDAQLLVERHVLERPHVVEAVGELDQQHADVLAHRQQHLAEALGLLLLARQVRDLAELGDAVDQAGDLGPEALVQVDDGQLRVLDRVVQQAGDHAAHVEADAGDRLRDAQRVHQVPPRRSCASARRGTCWPARTLARPATDRRLASGTADGASPATRVGVVRGRGVVGPSGALLCGPVSSGAMDSIVGPPRSSALRPRQPDVERLLARQHRLGRGLLAPRSGTSPTT